MDESETDGGIPRVLIIDDDDDLRSTLCLMLEDEGFDVVTASNGNLGLAVIREQPMDVVVTDILMPEKGGNEIIYEIRKTNPDIGIIVMSGGGRTENMDFLEFAKKQGADHAIQKPFDLDEFALLVRTLLQQNNRPDHSAANDTTSDQ